MPEPVHIPPQPAKCTKCGHTMSPAAQAAVGATYPRAMVDTSTERLWVEVKVNVGCPKGSTCRPVFKARLADLVGAQGAP